jgi:hypothetical protein
MTPDETRQLFAMPVLCELRLQLDRDAAPIIVTHGLVDQP